MMRFRQPRSTRHPRRGTSLIEIVVVMGVASIMLSAGLGLIHLLLRAEREGLKDVWHGRSLSRLAEAWRRDVHAAQELQTNESGAAENPRIVLNLPDGTNVTYAIDAHAVSRTANRGDAVARRDAFHFPVGSTIRFEVDDEPRFARVIIHRPTLPPKTTRTAEKQAADPTAAAPLSTGSSGRVTTLEALLARDFRYDVQETSP